ncbi:MAG: hypothetical protein FWC40_10300 [Proteobacteria bacterium]|nr:hypothetical protein [Pseudomonadota bacterium]
MSLNDAGTCPAPTWTDEGGTLVVRYHRYMRKDDQAQTSLHACTLTVDAEQEFTLECIDLGLLPSHE